MGADGIEILPYSGESPQSRRAFEQYLADIERGKGLFQLLAVASQITPEIRAAWSARSFTAVWTMEGEFDATVCNVSYHFHKHGQKYGSITLMTQEAKRYFDQHLRDAVDYQGMLRMPNGSLYETDGRIITFVG